MNKEIILSDVSDFNIKVELVDSGPAGKMPRHKWVSSTELQFENPDGTWGEIIDLGVAEDLSYEVLKDKPKIRGVELSGDLSLSDIKLNKIENKDIKKLL